MSKPKKPKPKPAADLPAEDYEAPTPPEARDTYADKMAELRQLLGLLAPVNKFAAKDSPKIREHILFILASGHTFKMAAEVVNIDPTTLWEWRHNDDKTLTEYGLKCEFAYELGSDVFEEEFIRRAREGVVRPVFQGGVLVGHERIFSDSLMQMLMSGRKSRVYGKQKLELTGDGGGPVAHTHKMEIEFVKPKKVKGDDE